MLVKISILPRYGIIRIIEIFSQIIGASPYREILGTFASQTINKIGWDIHVYNGIVYRNEYQFS